MKTGNFNLMAMHVAHLKVIWYTCEQNQSRQEELSNLFVVWENHTAAKPWKQADGRRCAILFHL